MASSSKLFFSFITFLSFFLLSSAQDSIINYDNEHHIGLPRSDNEVKVLYESWLMEHGKAYNAIVEKDRRFKIFKNNLKFIDEHNSANHSYELGLNKFADLTNDEYRSKFLIKRTDWDARLSAPKSSNRYASKVGLPIIPASIDWRKKGAVGSVRDQGLFCTFGSWAFAAVGAAEGINQIDTKEFISLSVQQLIDCVDANHGCLGGVITEGYQFIIDNGGIATEEEYPYGGSLFPTCKKDKKSVTLEGYQSIFARQDEVKIVVARQPVSAVIDAGSISFQFYKSGIFDDDCGPLYSHSIVIVGYDNENTSKINDNEKEIESSKYYNYFDDIVNEGDYYILKNSWGTGWGEKGYMRLKIDTTDPYGGTCKIAEEASFPIKYFKNSINVDAI